MNCTIYMEKVMTHKKHLVDEMLRYFSAQLCSKEVLLDLICNNR